MAFPLWIVFPLLIAVFSLPALGAGCQSLLDQRPLPDAVDDGFDAGASPPRENSRVVEQRLPTRPSPGKAGDGSAPNDAGMAGSVSCDEYCATVSAACGDYDQYPSPATCLWVCPLFELGDAEQPTGNTIACRLERARLARDQGIPEAACASAGPGGGGVCGTPCGGYCTILSSVCPSAGTFDDCMEACPYVPSLAEDPDEPISFSTRIDQGNSLECRTYHSMMAVLDSFTHCAHATGDAVCVAQ